MTKAELLEVAEELGLDVNESNTKAEIEAAIEEANNETTNDTPPKEETPTEAPKEPVTQEAAEPVDLPLFDVRGVVDYWYSMDNAGRKREATEHLMTMRRKITEILASFTTEELG